MFGGQRCCFAHLTARLQPIAARTRWSPGCGHFALVCCHVREAGFQQRTGARGAVPRGDNPVTAFYAFAEISFGRGEIDDALKAARRVCRLDPKHESGRVRFVHCLLAKDKKERAREVVEEGLRLLPRSSKLRRLQKGLGK